MRIEAVLGYLAMLRNTIHVQSIRAIKKLFIVLRTQPCYRFIVDRDN